MACLMVLAWNSHGKAKKKTRAATQYFQNTNVQYYCYISLFDVKSSEKRTE